METIGLIKIGLVLSALVFLWLAVRRYGKLREDKGYSRGVDDGGKIHHEALVEMLKKNVEGVTDPNAGLNVRKLHPKVREAGTDTNAGTGIRVDKVATGNRRTKKASTVHDA